MDNHNKLRTKCKLRQIGQITDAVLNYTFIYSPA